MLNMPLCLWGMCRIHLSPTFMNRQKSFIFWYIFILAMCPLMGFIREGSQKILLEKNPIQLKMCCSGILSTSPSDSKIWSMSLNFLEANSLCIRYGTQNCVSMITVSNTIPSCSTPSPNSTFTSLMGMIPLITPYISPLSSLTMQQGISSMPSFCLVALCYFKTSWKWSHDSMTSSLTEVLALSFIGIQARLLQLQ